MNKTHIYQILEKLVDLGKKEGLIKKNFMLKEILKNETETFEDKDLDEETIKFVKKLAKETEEEIRGRFKCDICGKDYKNKKIMEEHVDRVHHEVVLYKCVFCKDVRFMQSRSKKNKFIFNFINFYKFLVNFIIPYNL